MPPARKLENFDRPALPSYMRVEILIGYCMEMSHIQIIHTNHFVKSETSLYVPRKALYSFKIHKGQPHIPLINYLPGNALPPTPRTALNPASITVL